ncbi:D-alpha,beta-D-heptose 7-phosphate 1-kinase /D-beta-D-heptose 1-phosphate adenylyltransferase [Tistlia consotensis]|uniref:Bifunctional protein HldE n=2 Tax=Tistlia TaxID=1321364 RepID=A0A1Y6CMF6_9PROT|nr:D-alpha,beta-D-heptose 7-phosphate 1-kinase /D-beta-D-heptose 1-phosphate adenylyltransferase [Tistlia consotensis USBA 355]SNR95952.1 D-alpha,beta-D-heptose 7-phosphate 1-kinase /D-beta-D-heptose 1-phosphate adenylyltransferase [Tistlia consotensis]
MTSGQGVRGQAGERLAADLPGLLESLLDTPVLVMGDAMLDRFVEGRVERISPEGPIPVLRIERESATLGGAGNVLRNLAALGLAPHFLTAVGNDVAGRDIQRLAGEILGGGARLLVDPTITTTIKERFLSGGQQLLRADREADQLAKPAIVETLLELAEGQLGEVRALLLSDYGKGMLRHERLPRLIAAARAAGLPVVIDPKGRDYSLYRGASFVTPNRRELQEASGLSVGEPDQVVTACRRLIADHGIDAVLATLSEQGMILVRRDGDSVHLPAEAREVFDVSGAGDTVLATFGAALAAGAAAETAAQLANVAAGVVVGKRGTAVAYPAEILRAAQAQRLRGAELKVVDARTAAQEAADWRRAGLKVGFTNGCFDLLHPGHIHLLDQARDACDRLIVGLNSDSSVKRLKGDGRPIQDEAARATVLASLADVDRVVVFAEDTPLELIEQIRPDVLVKGADYTVEQVVGREVVESYGGRVVLAELKQGHSTSATIRKLAG